MKQGLSRMSRDHPRHAMRARMSKEGGGAITRRDGDSGDGTPKIAVNGSCQITERFYRTFFREMNLTCISILQCPRPRCDTGRMILIDEFVHFPPECECDDCPTWELGTGIEGDYAIMEWLDDGEITKTRLNYKVNNLTYTPTMLSWLRRNCRGLYGSNTRKVWAVRHQKPMRYWFERDDDASLARLFHG
jgi:hypothetical protein